jgi:hypothetical protein
MAAPDSLLLQISRLTMILSSINVTMCLVNCLFSDSDVDENGNVKAELRPRRVSVTGITNRFGFDKERLEKYKDEIISFLEQLPDSFKKGDSYLMGCVTKEGEVWGDTRDMELLYCLGIAIGKVEYRRGMEELNILKGTPHIIVKL